MASPIITVMSNAAVKASKGLLRDFGEVDNLQVSRKGAASFVTKSDLRAEKQLMVELQRARPEFGFLCEESGETKGQDSTHRWIIDPLDGTNNFIHAVPYFCISIALEKEVRPGQKEIIAAVIFDPVHNEMFAAEKNKGAFVNDRRMQVSKRTEMDTTMLASGHPRPGREDPAGLARIQQVSLTGARVRTNGAAALDLAYVAAGRYDGCWFPSLQAWDVAAGLLLVQEAGGLVTDFAGKPCDIYRGGVVAASRNAHPSLIKLLAVKDKAA